MIDPVKRYGRRIRKERRKRGILQPAFADIIGISERHLIQIEKGRVTCSWVIYQKINIVLGLSGEREQYDLKYIHS